MRVTITDVVLRDGLQDEDVLVSTADKLAIANALTAAGVPQLEVASFVSPTRVPQMADADAVVDRMQPHRTRTQISALALSANGVHRAVAAGVDVVRVVASVSSSHSRVNAGRSSDHALDELARAVADHPGQQFMGCVSTAFVCPYEGLISPTRLTETAERFASMGIRSLGLADTLGTATTDHVLSSVDALRGALPDVTVGLHLHDADGQALTTALAAAVDLGVGQFDSAAGGYGGCPFAPGAHGNLATEEVIAHFHAHGVDTGIDEGRLGEAVATARRMLARSPRIA